MLKNAYKSGAMDISKSDNQGKLNIRGLTKPRIGATQQKILLLLLGGLALGLTRTPKQYFAVVREIHEGWGDINRKELNRAIETLYKSSLVETKDNKDGTLALLLSKEGKKCALRYNLDTMQVKKQKQWDGKWRMVMFDVPESLKLVRESLRFHFRRMGFQEFQKSVYIHAYPCSSEIEYIVEFYNARRYIRFITALEIDNASAYKRSFGLH